MAPNTSEIARKVIEYINGKDLFWIHELMSDLGTDDIQTMSVLRRLRNKNHIQCSDRRGKSRQYIVISKVDFKVFTERKKREVKVVVRKKTKREKIRMSERMINYHKTKNKNK